MTPEDEKMEYGGEISFEDILSEYGVSREQQLLREVEEEALSLEDIDLAIADLDRWLSRDDPAAAAGEPETPREAAETPVKDVPLQNLADTDLSEPEPGPEPAEAPDNENAPPADTKEAPSDGAASAAAPDAKDVIASEPEPEPENLPEATPEPEPEPEPEPQPILLESIVGSTVDAVLQELSEQEKPPKQSFLDRLLHRRPKPQGVIRDKGMYWVAPTPLAADQPQPVPLVPDAPVIPQRDEAPADGESAEAAADAAPIEAAEPAGAQETDADEEPVIADAQEARSAYAPPPPEDYIDYPADVDPFAAAAQEMNLTVDDADIPALGETAESQGGKTPDAAKDARKAAAKPAGPESGKNSAEDALAGAAADGKAPAKATPGGRKPPAANARAAQMPASAKRAAASAAAAAGAAKAGTAAAGKTAAAAAAAGTTSAAAGAASSKAARSAASAADTAANELLPEGPALSEVLLGVVATVLTAILGFFGIEEASGKRVLPPQPEPALNDAAEKSGRLARRISGTAAPALLVGALPALLYLLEQLGVTVPLFSTSGQIRPLLLLFLLFFTAALTADSLRLTIKNVRQLVITSSSLILFAALLAAADCLLSLTGGETYGAEPFAAAAALGLALSHLGTKCDVTGRTAYLRTAAVAPPPYMVTVSEAGARKQNGAVRGYYTALNELPLPLRVQSVLSPVLLILTLILAFRASFGHGRGALLITVWSALLLAGATFIAPLFWGLYSSRMARRLVRSGSVLAGWRGAAEIGRRAKLVVTDDDLFPPGTLALNGIKVYGEDMLKVMSYAASMVRLSGMGLTRLFDDALRAEGGSYRRVEQFCFYEEGGCSGIIDGESVLIGSKSFLKSMGVILPEGIRVQHGLFLALDHRFAAIIAVRYTASEAVTYALRQLRRDRITAVLAVRDPNLTEAFLKKRFGQNLLLEYPGVKMRIALSDRRTRGTEEPAALILREGLAPLAECAGGSRRLRRRVIWTLLFSLAAAAAGLALVSYLSSLAAFTLLTPLSLTLFLLLWALPAVLTQT